MNDILKSAFDPEHFRQQGHELIDLLADLLEGQGKVSYATDPDKQLAYWKDYKIDNPISFYKDLFNNSIHLNNPKYIGHQVSVPAPDAVLAGLVSDFLNNGMGVFEMGAGATAIEKIVVDEFCKKVGFNSESDGFLTSGGTLANLTALLAARNHCQQQHPNKKPYILVSEQAHYCIDRAASTMGLDITQVIKLKTEDNFQLSIPALSEAIARYNSDEDCILAIVVSACGTATGAYDDVQLISEICRKHNIWMHVDGAHGGGALWSASYRHLLKGAEFADSIIIDAHKMMLVPALATAVLFRNGAASYRTFHQAASYLFEKQDDEWYNLAKRTYETTKFMMSIKIFVLLRYYGDQLIDTFVTRQYDLARRFAEHLQSSNDFQIAHFPMSNILCFRYYQPDLSDETLNRINLEIRKSIWEDGTFYIVQAKLNDIQYLRITIMNPKTEWSDLQALINHIIVKAKQINIKNLTS